VSGRLAGGRDREMSHAKHSPSISSIMSDPRRIIQKFKEEDVELRENEKNLKHSKGTRSASWVP